MSGFSIFAFEMRKALGHDAIIIGNAAGPTSNSALNGITIEMEACLDAQQCEEAIQAQKQATIEGGRDLFGVIK